MVANNNFFTSKYRVEWAERDFHVSQCQSSNLPHRLLLAVVRRLNFNKCIKEKNRCTNDRYPLQQECSFLNWKIIGHCSSRHFCIILFNTRRHRRSSFKHVLKNSRRDKRNHNIHSSRTASVLWLATTFCAPKILPNVPEMMVTTDGRTGIVVLKWP